LVAHHLVAIVHGSHSPGMLVCTQIPPSREGIRFEFSDSRVAVPFRDENAAHEEIKSFFFRQKSGTSQGIRR
jgi:hypothetical protein